MSDIFSHHVTSSDVAGVGASMRRPDAVAKVRGEFEYAPDAHDPDMLWGATHRSIHPRARIRRVDLNPAKAIPGVVAVLGAWDVPENTHGAIVKDQPVLAESEVNYVGEPIAIVAAVDQETARRAAAAVVVEYEPLVPITDGLTALNAGKIHRHVEYSYGDPSAMGEVQVEGEYRTSRQDHSFLAPDAGLARPDGQGGVVVTGATQWVHADRSEIAHCLGLPEEKVLVANSGVGGSFGGRVSMTWQVHGALLAMHTGRPVKFVYSRPEAFLALPPASFHHLGAPPREPRRPTGEGGGQAPPRGWAVHAHLAGGHRQRRQHDPGPLQHPQRPRGGLGGEDQQRHVWTVAGIRSGAADVRL